MRDNSIIFTEMEEYSTVNDCRFPIAVNLSNVICALTQALPRLTFLYRSGCKDFTSTLVSTLLSRTAAIVTDDT